MAQNINSEDEFQDFHLDKMRGLSNKFSEAKGQRIYLEHARKVLKSTIALEKRTGGAKSYQQQILEAEADPRYLELLEALKTATVIETRAYWELEITRIDFEKWRTQRADFRAAANLR